MMENYEDLISRIMSFYAHPGVYNDAFVEGDNLGKTFSCCGAILLAGAFSGSRSSKLLAYLTVLWTGVS